ncbi:hypothetical protein HNQ59_002461 [Chitinivorax tropicus]|uniref:Uncharacterized protein n=1 Tax=Chitinivorax tropicus TaxID=714531 RepID=A0A840MSA6_9PROT|nr:hypothetical protein [Chitinivorax tropicus]MBB5019163.1 hypothetical protein [Chitinivorax tropicus]
MRYILIIGWLYVALMFSIASNSWVDGLLKFLFLGVFITAVLLWLANSWARQKKREMKENINMDE